MAPKLLVVRKRAPGQQQQVSEMEV